MCILHIHYLLIYYSSNEITRLYRFSWKHQIMVIRRVRRPFITCSVFSILQNWELSWKFGIFVLKYHWKISEILEACLWQPWVFCLNKTIQTTFHYGRKWRLLTVMACLITNAAFKLFKSVHTHATILQSCQLKCLPLTCWQNVVLNS